jgi:cytochrome c oxidase cbb3-type subunit 3
MADLPTGFWSGWVLVMTLVSLAGLAWLVLSVYFTPDDEHTGTAETVWDTDLREGNSAPPFWWFWMLLAAMVFSLVYLMLYPGLGSFSGLLNWSQGSRIMESYGAFEENFDARRAAIATASLTEIQNDPQLVATAERIFKRECAACHGPDGRGQAALFPNLKDIDWQWGGSPELIEQTIRQGRSAMMPAWEQVLGYEDIEFVADYVIALGAGAANNSRGQAVFAQYCAACHGAQGSGNPLLGAPNLTDNSWLYGGSRRAVIASITAGRNGIMPAFSNRLDAAQIRLLVALLAR